MLDKNYLLRTFAHAKCWFPHIHNISNLNIDRYVCVASVASRKISIITFLSNFTALYTTHKKDRYTLRKAPPLACKKLLAAPHPPRLIIIAQPHSVCTYSSCFSSSSPNGLFSRSWLDTSISKQNLGDLSLNLSNQTGHSHI